MGENDRELGEITTMLKVLGQSIAKIESHIEKMQTEGCVLGKSNKDRINELEGTIKKLVFVSVTILVGGQAGIETVKALFF